ncbi:Hypothetical protein SMAX5B_019478 [Scophthalmus maximus]|uniref:Uncharacterized protein n=1 Tax=Scophthalmus maximus TaxID=52904 RepID=A0A2U9B1K9_SCOMX|nr:Hypothetical protein SMAX5B_019478 [Scophthalmus maximus]
MSDNERVESLERQTIRPNFSITNWRRTEMHRGRAVHSERDCEITDSMKNTEGIVHTARVLSVGPRDATSIRRNSIGRGGEVRGRDR